ncbi:hypothetical protein [Saprospira grandis]|uniref:hypothetical protein n=1 Tax=Saprospira grandis TaxID=1008 RepID=UPI0022DD1A54|nr:hypothetical protein [Saprospira grandis]WBM76118.1 hypothetical protein OP864_07770 [Saprospira grandis]
MLEPIPVKADRITAEGSSFWDWAKIGAEIAIGFTPFGVVLDVIDLGKAIAGGNPTDIAIAMIGFLPAGDLLKAGKKIGGGLEKMLKHTDELAPFGVQPPKLQAPPKELEKLKELQKQVPEGPKAAKESPPIQNNDAPKVETPKAEPPKLEEPQLKEPELKEEIPLEKELGKQEAPEIEFGSQLPPKIYKLADENFVLLQKGKLGKYGEGDKIPKAEYEKLIREYKREQLAAKKSKEKPLNVLKEVSIEKLQRAGKQIDKGGQLTKAGRGLQKHGSREGSVFPPAKGSPKQINEQGEKILTKILLQKDAVRTTRHHARFGDILDIRIPGGMGARFSSDGKKFITFLEPE